MTKVSVLMSVYNTQEEYLREAIDSILNQTYKDFEFVIVDDGSTNNAPEILKEYQNIHLVYVLVKDILNIKRIGEIYGN